MKNIIILLLISVICVSCGVKGSLSKPEGQEERRTYPRY